MNLSESISRSFLLLFAISAATQPATNMATAANTKKAGCRGSCGNVTVPYPFGVGLNSGCSLSGPTYDIVCLTSTTGAQKPYLYTSNYSSKLGGLLEVLDISETQIQIRNSVAFKCFNSSGRVTSHELKDELAYMDLDPDSPFAFSSASNRLTVVGCADSASIFGIPIAANNYASCNTMCSSVEDVVSEQCNGKGCCQVAVPKGMRGISITTGTQTNNSQVAGFNPCGYAFLGAYDKFVFHGASDLDDSIGFINRIVTNVPIVLNWVIGSQTCSLARKNVTSYACQQNTTCSDDVESGIGGYRCSCLSGYQGNPYLPPGCIDIDECDYPSLNQCSNICHNTEGGHFCTCPHGYFGDAKKKGTGCMKKSSQVFVLKLGLGLSFGFLLVVVALCWIYFIGRRRKLIRMKGKFFQQNGGMLMKELLSKANISGMESSKIFTSKELEAATNNFSEDRILGKGGFGTVYKGVLPDKQVVAIKKSKMVDQTQIDQFINEMVILTQVNHRNVVKLLGCCLETEVPLIVYEYISNGTLSEHIQKSRGRGEPSWLTWSNCLRIATEAADAFAYLHSAASPPIIHRDVKSANILLDHTYTTKISDFGASRLIPLDQSEVATNVLGTFGYLDPEYYGSCVLTEKSDVYSFGVVIAELLTRVKALDLEKPPGEQHLSVCFLNSIEEERMFEIIDPRIVSEASREQLMAMGILVQKCFSEEGKDRPTMREVAMELETIKKLKRRPWEEQGYQVIDTNGLDNEEGDLYPIPSFESR